MASMNPNYTAGEYQPTVIMENESESNLKSLSQLEIYWRRFRTHKLAVGGIVVFGLLVLMAIFAPLFTPGITPINLNIQFGFGNHGPTLENFPWRIFGLTSPDDGDRSVLAEVTYGARISLFIGIVSAVLTTLIGTIVGAISGYFLGWVDTLIMRVTDIFLTIPYLPLVIAITAIYASNQSNIWLLISIFTLTSWAGIARLVRSSFLSLREMEFNEAARAVGVNDWRIIFRHLLPNAISPIIVVTTLNVANFIVAEATLDFLGLGIRFPPDASWGNVLSDAQGDLLTGNWWWPLFPGIFLVLTVLSINFIGDGLRDALDVRSRVD